MRRPWISFAVLVIAGALVYRLADPDDGDRFASWPPTSDDARIQMLSLWNAIDPYRLTHERMPRSLDELTTPDPEGVPFLDEVPDDPWGTRYDYRSDGRQDHRLRSAGPDKRFDTDDDIVHGDR